MLLILLLYHLFGWKKRRKNKNKFDKKDCLVQFLILKCQKTNPPTGLAGLFFG
jgi:hypothetical protein